MMCDTADAVRLDLGMMPACGTMLVVAVSGGVDSMALWDLLAADGRWPLAVWHLNHGLRPEASADAEAIAVHARRLATEGRSPAVLRCEHAAVADLATTWGVGIEEAGRRHRYERLAAFATEIGAAAVVTAHHRDDQAETVLMNLLRGAGPRGWRGIARTRALTNNIALVRPALHVSRSHLRNHAIARGIAWSDDASNTDVRFRRNQMRRLVLPGFETGCPGFTKALLERAASIADNYAQLEMRAERRLDSGWNEGAVECSAFSHASSDEKTEMLAIWLRRLGIEVDRHRLGRLSDLLNGDPNRRLSLGPWLLLRRARRVVWSRN